MDLELLPALLIVLAVANVAGTRIPACAGLLHQLGNRQPQIDGLRGVCALAVSQHHFAYLAYWNIPLWELPAGNSVVATVGKAGVAEFFLICALLFWSRLPALKASGWAGWRGFAENRIRRIVPMYIFAMSAAIGVLGFAARSGEPWAPWGELASNGLKAYSFWFFPPNGFNYSLRAAAAFGVAWTLKYEWLFYASLPLLACIKVERLWCLSLAFAIMVNELWVGWYWIEYFLYGGIVLQLSSEPWLRRVAQSHIASFASLGLTGATVFFTGPEKLALGLPVLGLATGFLLIAAGNSWFGLLATPGARLVGAGSYSIYLLNFVVQVPLVRALPADPSSWHWMLTVGAMSACSAVVVAVALITYRYVELTFQRPHRKWALPVPQEQAR